MEPNQAKASTPRNRVDPRPWAVRRYPVLLLLTAAATTLLGLVHVWVGGGGLQPAEVLAVLCGEPVEESHRDIVWGLRVPRMLIGATAGALLGLAGGLLQAILHNPLGEPGVLGVSAGATLAVVIVLALRPAGSLVAWLPLAAAVGGLGAGVLVYVLCWQAGTDPFRLVMTGLLVNAFLDAATALLLVRSGVALPGVLGWLMGSLNGRVWAHWSLMWPLASMGIPLGLLGARVANLLQLGDDVATATGLHPQRARAGLFGVSVVLAATAASVVGTLGFVGLIAPHAARLLVGSDTRRYLLLGAALGAVMLVSADAAAQAIHFRLSVSGGPGATGVPVGAVMAFLGAPFFLYLLGRESGRPLGRNIQ